MFRVFTKLKLAIHQYTTQLVFKRRAVDYVSFISRGVPYVAVYKNGLFKIGKNFRMNNAFESYVIGRQQKCIFVVKGKLTIGDNVGMSSSAIVCHNSVTIGNSVLIGGNTVIYDTDFHSLDYRDRIAIPEVFSNVKTAPVTIGNNVFIGGHSTILKGVSIGDNSVIGAGSVLTKSVPANEIWAGNPAVKIKSIE